MQVVRERSRACNVFFRRYGTGSIYMMISNNEKNKKLLKILYRILKGMILMCIATAHLYIT